MSTFSPVFKKDFITAPDGRDWELADVIDYVTNLPEQGGFKPQGPQLQYHRGYCGAFGPCIAMRSVHGRAFSPLFHQHFNKKYDNLPNSEGTTMEATLKVCRKHGFLPEERLPYLTHIDTPLANMPITQAMIDEAAKYKVGGSARCRTLNDMKQALNAGFPLIYGHIVSEEYAYDNDGWIRSFFGLIVGGHISNILWYDDTKKFTFTFESGATETKIGFFDGSQTWEDRNRPGQNKLWGDDGIAHLCYDIINEKTDLGMRFLDSVYALIPTAEQAANFKRRKKVVKFQIGNPYYTVNGVQYKIDAASNLAPMILNNRTMIPVRVAAEALGAKVEWEDATRTVKFTDSDGDVIRLEIGSAEIEINSYELDKKMDQVAMIVNDRTMVPLRFVAEAMSTTVEWDASNQTAIITKY